MQLEGCGKVELGATWFHGIVGNPLYEHAIQLGLMTRHEAEDSSKCSKAVYRISTPFCICSTTPVIRFIMTG